MASIVQKIITYRLKMHYVYGKGFRAQRRRSNAALEPGTVTVRKVDFMHPVNIVIT
jgi:hypothetical protein